MRPMESQKDYLRRRADEEDAAADLAASEKARQLHHELAIRYRDAAVTDGAGSDTERVNSTRPKEFRVID